MKHIMGWNKTLVNRVCPVDAKGFEDILLSHEIKMEYDNLYGTVLGVKNLVELERNLFAMNKSRRS